MTLSRCIDEYVRHRRSLGVCFHGEQVRLRAFVKAVGDVALADVTPEAVRRYLDGSGPVTQSWFCRFHTVTGFYRFAIARQYVDRSPLPSRPPKPPAEFIPYIYSEADLRALLEAVDARYEEDWLVRPTTIRTLLLLLYATGLRISEALALTNADVDLAGAILTVRETKFCKSRLVPIGPDLGGVLARYRDQPGKKFARRPHASFLADRDGHRILRQTAELIFKRVREQAGLERPTCRTFRPRLHDFRQYAVSPIMPNSAWGECLWRR
jgi:site-specific recombinase XerD